MKKIDGQLLREMLLTGNHLLQKNRELIDALNVFPVPDGDTGTNMGLTFNSAVAEIKTSSSNDLGELVAKLNMGALTGARGNSGVILSQLIKGFSDKAHNKKELTVKELWECFQAGVETAYKAVMKPIEGTILTVAREAALGGKEATYKGEIEDLLEAIYKAGEKALAKTPEQLPALKQAGVVDAGGKGWLLILEGFLLAARGKGISDSEYITDNLTGNITSQNLRSFQQDTSPEALELEFNYCTEFIIKGRDLSENKLKSQLIPLGDCLLVVGSPELLKVHIHSNDPGKALQIGLAHGTLHQIKIENMAEQHQEKFFNSSEEAIAENLLEEKSEVVPIKPLGVLAVAMGEGIGEVLTSLGVDKVIYGGQTMNPSIGDLNEAIKAISAHEIIILPNNSNIILTAQQVANMSDRNIQVVPTKSIPQGISAMMAYNPQGSLVDNSKEMTELTQGVSTGEVTYAVRDSQYDGWDIKAGNILGLLNDKITVVGESPEKVVEDMLSNYIEAGQLITIYYGEEITADRAEGLINELTAKFPRAEFELHLGGQPLYSYIFSIE
jgi:uncharacterized protein